MRLSEQTKVFNVLIATIKSVGGLIKGVFEININLEDNRSAKPDFLCYFEYEEINFYILFELKKRTIISEDDINKNIIPQYKNYLELQIKNLDSTLIPRKLNAEKFIDYIFFNSPNNIIINIIEKVPILEPTNVYSINLPNKNFSEVFVLNDTINLKYMTKLLEASENKELWDKIYIPFLLEDILDISGTNKNRIEIEKNAGILLTNQFLQFLISKKIKEENTEFRVIDFIDYAFMHNYNRINMGRQEKEALKSKIRMFLYFLAEDIQKKIEIPEIIRKLGINHFRIIIRNTDTLVERVNEIKKEIINLFTQKKITDFFNGEI